MGSAKKPLLGLGARKRWLSTLCNVRPSKRRSLQSDPSSTPHSSNPPPTILSQANNLRKESSEAKPFTSSDASSTPHSSKPLPTSLSQANNPRKENSEAKPFTFSYQMNGNSKKPSRSLTKKKDQNRRGQDHAEKTHQRKPYFSSEKRKRSGDGGLNTYQTTATRNIDLHPVRKKVDAETLQYFEEISSLLGTGTQMEDTEERMVLIENAVEETHGKECELACEKSCSRVLEMLIFSSNSMQVASLLHRLSPSFIVVSNDVAGSHVVEALLKSAAVILREHDPEAAWYKTFEQAFTLICRVLGERIVEVMSNCYGSHVVRSLLAVLSGLTLEASHKGSRGGGLSSRLSLSQNPVDSLKQGDIIFPHLLQLLTSKILEAVKEETLQLCMDPFASPVLQTLLRVLARDAGAVTEALCILLGTNKEDEMSDQFFAENLRQIMFDNCGSHLVEVMLEVAPGDVYKKMFQQILTPHLLEYATHPSANFVVQALIVSLQDQDQVTSLLSVLKPNFWTLMRGKRSGILTSLLKACKKYETSEQEVCSSLAKALNLDAARESCLVLRLLYLEGYASSNGSKDWRPRFKERMSVLGCAMLQLIFSLPTECNQLFWLSLLDMESAEILATIKDPGGCHVIERFLTSEIPSKHKNRLIAKLKGHFADLASQMFSAFTLEKCFRAGTIDLKEAIVSELAPIQTDIAKSKHGPHYIKSFDVLGYSKSPDHWRSRFIAKEGTLKAFADVFDLNKASMKRPQKDKRKATAMGFESGLRGNKKRKIDAESLRR